MGPRTGSYEAQTLVGLQFYKIGASSKLFGIFSFWFCKSKIFGFGFGSAVDVASFVRLAIQLADRKPARVRFEMSSSLIAHLTNELNMN